MRLNFANFAQEELSWILYAEKMHTHLRNSEFSSGLISCSKEIFLSIYGP